jgi:hypothetical protein
MLFSEGAVEELLACLQSQFAVAAISASKGDISETIAVGARGRYGVRLFDIRSDTGRPEQLILVVAEPKQYALLRSDVRRWCAPAECTFAFKAPDERIRAAEITSRLRPGVHFSFEAGYYPAGWFALLGAALARRSQEQ